MHNLKLHHQKASLDGNTGGANPTENNMNYAAA